MPFTDHASFTSAATAFAQQHYSTGTAPSHLSQPLIARHVLDPEDIGEKISRTANIADFEPPSLHPLSHPEDVGEAVSRVSMPSGANAAQDSIHSVVKPQDLGEKVSRSRDKQAGFSNADLAGDSLHEGHAQGVQTSHLDAARQCIESHSSNPEPLSQAVTPAQQTRRVSQPLAQGTALIKHGRTDMDDTGQLQQPHNHFVISGGMHAQEQIRGVSSLSRQTGQADRDMACSDLLVFEDR